MRGADHAGVFVPPPLLFVTPLAIAAILHARYPWALAEGSTVPGLGGWLTTLTGIAIGLASVHAFRRASTTILPIGRPTTAIVSAGPYRVTRNPMYVAMTIAYLGLAGVLNTAWALVLLPGVLIGVDRWVIRREERYLAAKFGEPYRDYCTRVRRWL